MDTDTQTVIKTLDKALELSEMTATAFARALGTSGSRFSTYRTGRTAPTAAFVFRAIRLASALARARAERSPTSLDAATAIRRAEARGDEDRTLAIVLEARDRLRYILETNPEAAEAWDAHPDLDDDRWATLFAALTAHEFIEAGRPSPGWTERPRLDIAWTLDSPRLTLDQVREQTPDWLAARNVFVAPRDLATV